jgi:transposase-like protein
MHRQVVGLVWCCQDWSFVAIAAGYKGYRYPIEVIGHTVWLYHRFALSLRDVEELMLARGVVVTYETIVRHEVARDEWTARMEVRMKG